MTQEEINTLYEITIMIHENDWFGKRKKPKDRELVQEWVAQTLANTLQIYTIPVGMSWGMKVDENTYNEYWNEHSKLNKTK